MNGGRTVASVHNDWLTLVEPVGAFLTIPVLKRVFPNGIAPVDRDVRADVRQRLDELTSDVAARTAWLQWIARDLLSLGPRLREASAIPAGLTHTVAERHTTLRPDFVVVEPQKDGEDRARLLGIRWPLRTPLDRRPTTDERGQPTTWAATPIERAALLCRAVNVPLALVTDTDRFALVWAPASGPSGHAIWTSSLFGEERLLLDSFAAVLGAQRFFGVAEKETLEALLTESGSAQAEVTGKLGEQVRKAVELLVDAFSRADRAAGGRILAAVQPSHVYNAAVTVMMRLVVLLAAEERRLLPADDPIYSASYSILTTRDQLERDAMRDGIETLEKRHAAWHRLLATFRAVHAGIEHDRLRLPAYGGSLFDPSRYAFLEVPPIPVDDRAMLAVLDALQVLSFRQGSVTEARRISYLNLDVEQIGHVYEGLLDHGCARVDEVVLGLVGSKGEEPEIALSELERELRGDEDSFAEWVAEKGGPQATRVKKLLYEDLDPDQDHRLLAACDNDQATYDRVRPFSGLLRKDLREMPAVFMPRALYVTQVSLRRDSGTAYTTKELADEVVRYALEPLAHSPGPAEGAEPADWKLKSSAELLRLKVCDPAVGSGAILVAACRYLADRLVEAWKAEANTGPLPPVLEGVHESEWTLVARRSVTDHCLYGVDRNPMALEMAKLSLWLTTMAKERPFTFLDHQVRSGDSLLGITSLDQVRWVHIDPERGKKLWEDKPLFTDPRRAVDARVTEALEGARALAAIDVISLGDVDRKARLHAEMVEALAALRVLADAVIGSALAEAGGEGKIDALLESIANRVETAFNEDETTQTREHALAEVHDQAQFWLDTDRPDLALDRSCLHWPLAFPEVFLSPGRSGFDAIVGNPPFLGGQRITGALGTAYRNYLVDVLAGGRRGSADLVAYFFLRAFALLGAPGGFGLLATNTIAQGDTREVGLDQLVERCATITRAVPSERWPGTTSLEVAKVWIRKGEWQGPHILSGAPVRGISPMLVIPGRAVGRPYRLKANEGKSFQGSNVLGLGFVMTPEEAHALIDRDRRNCEVLLPYLNGEDLNSRPDQSASRWVINFRDWPLDRTAKGSWARADEDQRTKWRRSGCVPGDYPEPVAADFPGCLEIVRTKVKPERDKNPRKQRRERWWQYAERAPELYATIAGLERVLLRALTSKHHGFAFVKNMAVFDQTAPVYCFDDHAHFGLLQSEVVCQWGLEHGASLESRPRFTPSDCFETFPFPDAIGGLGGIGEAYDDQRGRLMAANAEGLTKTYNRLHSPDERSVAIVRLRDLHRDLALAALASYGWAISPNVDFHETRYGLRFTIGSDARQEVLDRLLELNHRRYAEEVAQGLHERSTSKGKKGATTMKKNKKVPKGSPLLEGV
ncbi:MAG: restriction endonuclease [Vicinamibacterales bacterium]